MALLGRTELGIEDKSHGVSVGNNPRSHLMYYLNCVSSLLGLENDDEIKRLTQFNRHDLSNDESESLLAYCYVLSPDVLLDKCMFHNEELCGDSSNKFFELSLAETHLAVTDSIVIGGQRRQVRKIVVYNARWISENWAEPMKELVEERKRQQEEEERNKRKQQGSCCTII